jgi:hypothetical protein
MSDPLLLDYDQPQSTLASVFTACWIRSESAINCPVHHNCWQGGWATHAQARFWRKPITHWRNPKAESAALLAEGRDAGTHSADDATGLLRLANDGRPIRSDTARPVDAVGASDRGFGAVRRRCFVDDGGPIRPGASRSVDPVGTSDRVALLGESEHAGRNNAGEYDLLHVICLLFNNPEALLA